MESNSSLYGVSNNRFYQRKKLFCALVKVDDIKLWSCSYYSSLSSSIKSTNLSSTCMETNSTLYGLSATIIQLYQRNILLCALLKVDWIPSHGWVHNSFVLGPRGVPMHNGLHYFQSPFMKVLWNTSFFPSIGKEMIWEVSQCNMHYETS